MNIFIQMIYEKCNPSVKGLFKYLKHRSKLKKFRKNIIEGSPCFNVLWNMADFIKLAEEVFFYNNIVDNTDIRLFSSRNFMEGENGLILNTSDASITIKLYAKSSKVALEVKRKNGNKLKTLLTFENNEWTTQPTFRDEMLLEHIIKELNMRIIELFDRCYDSQ